VSAAVQRISGWEEHGHWRTMDRAAFAAVAVERFEPQREILREYYDFDLVGSTEARRKWVEPTLRSL
jgi:hypothetical protein